MSSLLLNTLNELFFHYPNAEQQRKILDYAASMTDRVAATKALAKLESAVIDATLNRFAAPELWASVAEDLKLVLRACAQATLLDNRALLDDQLLFWMAELHEQLETPPQTICRAYEALEAELHDRLDPIHSALVLPNLRYCTERLSNIPQPASASRLQEVQP